MEGLCQRCHKILWSKSVDSVFKFCFLLLVQFLFFGSFTKSGSVFGWIPSSNHCGHITLTSPLPFRSFHNEGKSFASKITSHKMTADTTTAEVKETATVTNRLFLSHIDYKNYEDENTDSMETDRSPEEVRQKLEEIFSKFGSVLEIYLSGKEDSSKINDNDQARPPFAFIAMETAQEAQAALDGIDSQQKQRLFRDVAPAHVHKSKKNKQNKNERLRSERIKEYRDRSAAISSANVICQVHSSHLDRLQEFALSKNGVSLVTSFSAQKGTSLLFLKVVSPADENGDDYLERFSRSLWDTWFVAPNLNRITLLTESKTVDTDTINGHRVEGNIRKGVVPAIFRSLSEVESDKVSLRLAIFPPKLQRSLLEGLEEYNEARKDDENDCCKNMDIQFSPGNPTHSISIVQVHPGVVVTPKSKGDNEKSLYALGRLEEVPQTRKRSLSEDSNASGDNKYRFQQQRTSQVPQLAHNSNLKAISSSTTTPEDGNAVDTEDDKSISRAYWKLQEAWERYKYKTPSLESLGKDTMWALDCGAAPGGWTKFLFRPGIVDRIYAVDPGKLAKEVAYGLDEANQSESPIVRHVEKTIQKALPGLAAELREEKGGKFLDIWVSDMCVKDMNGQVDCFLQARDEGVVGPGTFFVLTLKCILGYSATAFDQQTQEQVKRLEGISRDIHVVHLFSNRSSERTVIGYLI